MNDQEEKVFIKGSQMAWRTMLSECLKNLGHGDLEAERARWILERKAAISMLRKLCDEFGDNDWEENLHLADIIEKHLGRYLSKPIEGEEKEQGK